MITSHKKAPFNICILKEARCVLEDIDVEGKGGVGGVAGVFDAADAGFEEFVERLGGGGACLEQGDGFGEFADLFGVVNGLGGGGDEFVLLGGGFGKLGIEKGFALDEVFLGV